MTTSSISSYGNGNVYTTIQRLESSNAQFGLANKNLAQERIQSLRNVDLASEPSPYTIISEVDALDSKADHGLNDRNTSNERRTYIEGMHQRVVQNHGFEAKQATIEALTHNTKIVNIPPDQRGTIADLSS